MNDTTTTNVNAEDLTAHHIGKVVTVRGKSADERLRGRLVDLHFDTERTAQLDGGLRHGHVELTLRILFRHRLIDVEVGPNAVLEVED